MGHTRLSTIVLSLSYNAVQQGSPPLRLEFFRPVGFRLDGRKARDWLPEMVKCICQASLKLNGADDAVPSHFLWELDLSRFQQDDEDRPSVLEWQNIFLISHGSRAIAML